jgi:alkylation response protein AidB-like acyl-CoA dehydrogenase
LAKVDPSVSVMVDVHNTLVNTTVLKYGTNESKRKWLPKLATNTVGKSFLHLFPPSTKIPVKLTHPS